MVLSDDLSTYAKVGMLEPLDTYMQTDADFNKNRYFSTTLNAGNIYDHQYALPYESSPTLMFVNKTLLEENGIAIPNVDWTWDDFYSICEKLTVDTDGNGEIDQFGEYGYTWQNALSSNGQALYDEESMKCTLQKQDVYSAIEFVRQLNRLNRNQNVTSELFDKGKVAFCPMMFSEYRTYKPYPWSVKNIQVLNGIVFQCLQDLVAIMYRKWIVYFVESVKCPLRKKWLGNFEVTLL